MDSAREVRVEDLERCVALVAEALKEGASVRGGERLAVLGAPGGGRPASGSGDGGADPRSLVDAWASADPDRTLIVGAFDGVTVGLGLGSISNGTARVGRVDLCYVEPGARGVGVGSTVLGALLEWFAQRECTDIDALALPGDRAMKQLLEAAGFKARLLVLHRQSG